MLPEIDPKEAWALIEAGKARLVDVREPDEIESVHAPCALAAPLSILNSVALPDSEQISLFTCQSGRRTTKAADVLVAKAKGEAMMIKGGMKAWIAAGLPVTRGKQYSLERQIRIVAGSIVLLGSLLTFVHPGFLVVPLFVGSGLIYAGVTGSCAMGLLLKRMPWNK